MDEDLFAVFESKSEKPSDTRKNSKNKEKPEEIEPSVDDLLQQLTAGKRAAEEASGDELDGEEDAKKFKAEEEAADDAKLAEQMPRIAVHTIDTESCVHEVCVPPDEEYVPLKSPTSEPPKQYPFVLDPFQTEAILCLENSQSVLVSAHTSAGKTVIAEYAIALSLRDKQRVIYTTPIKALSNQKYREFNEEFGDVGLMTGDVTINPTASCLIMTTEILRSMLYRGSEIMREVAWVVFDEIHYMRDKSRGYVWEETIILLPDSIHYVFLSATIPNARQFAEWITYLHKQPCHVVYTDYRPTPLQHYIYPAGGDGIHLVVDEQGNFREDNFSAAMSGLAPPEEGKKPGRPQKTGKEGSNVYKIVKMIMERNLAPVICFSFSKKECEAYALQMAKLDFNTGEEKKLVEEVFNNAMDVLSEEDRQLPQVEHVLPLLRRGIGIHHGGLLPILKETIEILFGEGLIKALFATETFAMGLNMPARTVLFTGCRKFDGKDFRWISSGEYIQMSGRAGRRGKDDKGIVILMVDESMSPAVGKGLVKGLADPLNSAYNLTYNMVLNLLRVEEINPEYMLERSFFQFQNYAAIPGLCDRVNQARTSHDELAVDREPEVAAYYQLRQQLSTLKKDYQKYITLPKYIVPFLNPGRVVHVQTDDKDFDWCVVINYKKEDAKTADSQLNPTGASSTYVVDVLMHVSKETAKLKDTGLLEPPPADQKGEMVVVPVLVHLIHEISAVRLKYPQDLRPLDNRMIVLKTIREMKRRFPQGIPRLDAVKDMGIRDAEFVSLTGKIASFEQRLFAHSLHDDPRLDDLYNQYAEKVSLSNELKAAKLELRRAKSLLQMDELKCRKRVLRRLGYCTSAGVIEVKGRVACELSSADELLITEMIFNGMFNELSVPQSVALMACFTFDEKTSDQPKLQDQLSGALRQMQELARRIARVSIEAKLELDEENYVGQFKPAMMDVVHAWCQGASFAEICKMTDAFEGSVIRCMRRLEELLRQMVQAAKGIGNTDLENKFSEGIRVMKRDIVFAASLYL